MSDLENTASNKQVLLRSVLEYFDAAGWEYAQYGEEGEVLEVSMYVGGTMEHCRLMVSCNDADIQVFAVAPVSATKENYANVVEFLTRANIQLRIGAFQFEYDTGEISFHACLLCSEGVPSLNDIMIITGLPVVMMERYGNGIMKNILGQGNPAQDIAELD